MTAQDKIGAYYEARTDYDRLHAMSSAAHITMKNAEREAVNAMLEEGIKSIGQDDGTHVSLRKRFECSITIDNEDAVRAWLTEVEGDDAQFVVEKVHKPAVLEWMKEEFEKTMDEGDVPDFMNFTQQPALTVRGWKTRETK